jgi:hypothetical protein
MDFTIDSWKSIGHHLIEGVHDYLVEKVNNNL